MTFPRPRCRFLGRFLFQKPRKRPQRGSEEKLIKCRYATISDIVTNIFKISGAKPFDRKCRKIGFFCQVAWLVSKHMHMHIYIVTYLDLINLVLVILVRVQFATICNPIGLIVIVVSSNQSRPNFRLTFADP